MARFLSAKMPIYVPSKCCLCIMALQIVKAMVIIFNGIKRRSQPLLGTNKVMSYS
uniref:Uncharacterized protein n=1 Tax=Anguilla anguilla TaxID=7936 RepID=A0A0E9SFK0_ANGAN